MIGSIATAEDFSGRFNVPRETMARLEVFQALVVKWTQSINLISRTSVADIWPRHFADSAQLWALRPARVMTWADLGAGAGFPGLVIAAMASAEAPQTTVVLVESDARKCVFLAEAARKMDLSVRIENTRVETLEPLRADIISARALAPLDALLAHLQKHRAPGGIGLFPKGATVHKELKAAERNWRFEHRIHDSITEPGAAILEIGDVSLG